MLQWYHAENYPDPQNDPPCIYLLVQIVDKAQRYNLDGHFNVMGHSAVALRRFLWCGIHFKERVSRKRKECIRLLLER